MDVSHTFTTNFLFRNFHSTTIADNTFVTDTLVLTAMALIVLDRTERYAHRTNRHAQAYTYDS